MITGFRQIKQILDNPTSSISEKRASLGDSSEIQDFLIVIAELHPDKAVIGDDKFTWRRTFRFTKEEPTLTDAKL
jgi:hypothetical protein